MEDLEDDDPPPIYRGGRHSPYAEDEACDGCSCCTYAGCPGACEWEHCPCRADS